jgi:hypothetical protein
MRNDKALRKNLEMPGHKKDLGVPPNRQSPLGVGCCVSSPLPNASLSGSGLYTALVPRGKRRFGAPSRGIADYAARFGSPARTPEWSEVRLSPHHHMHPCQQGPFQLCISIAAA